MIVVYHYANDFAHYPCNEAEVKDAIAKGLYRQVCIVYTNDLEYAYSLTQNIADSWTNGDEVFTGLEGCRSTMIGDLLEKNGDMFWVDRIGFKAI
jgi:hypothetical protein